MASLSDAFGHILNAEKRQPQRKMVEGFNSNPMPGYQEFREESSNQFNTFANLNIDNKSNDFTGMTATPNVQNPQKGAVAMQIDGSNLGNRMSANEVAAQAKKCEAHGNDCSAFDNASGFQGCGMCLKVGTNSAGEAHTGGLYVGSGIFPALGTCPPGYFAKNKQECLAIKRRIECETNNSFGEDCWQCHDDGKFYIVDPANVNAASMYLSGNGSAVVKLKGTKVAEFNLSSDWKEVRLAIQNTPIRELDEVEISVDDANGPELYGFVTGPVKNGNAMFLMDVARFMLIDSQTNSTPRSNAKTADYKGYSIAGFTSGMGKTGMRFPFNVPFSFLTSDSCPVSPFVGSEASAKRLESSACYKKGSAPGNYSTECLEEIYYNSGCTGKGSLAPTTAEGAKALMYSGTEARKLTNIVGFLNNTYIEATTGKTYNGTKLSLEEWNKQSMACMGKSILSPCDVPRPDGTLSDDCIQYLYENNGAGNRVGATYTLNNMASLRKGKDAYCTDKGTAAPYNAANLKTAREKGEIDKVKAYFDGLHRGMYASNISNSARSEFTKACIGIDADVRDDLPAPLGVLARYVRLLRNPKPTYHLQISKLEVIDRTGRDIALGKPTAAKSEWPGLTKDKPVNGKEWFYWNMYHDGNESSDPNSTSQEYWIVDLGEMKDVCLVHYYNRLDYAQYRSEGVRVQLLDENKNVVAEKVLGQGYIQSCSYIKPGSSDEDIKKLLMSYENAISLVQYDRSNTGNTKKLYLSYMLQHTGTSPNESDQTYNNIPIINLSMVPASFRTRYSEKGREKDLISLSPVGKPNTLIRHAGYKMHAMVPTAMDLFRNDSSFRVISGSEPGYVRLQAVNFPDRYIGTKKISNGSTRRDEVYILKEGEGNIEWKIEVPFQKVPDNMKEVYLSSYRNKDFDYNLAELRCKSLGASIASKSQMEEAQRNGANWCYDGHVGAGTSLMSVCNGALKETPTNKWTRADVYCYGPKPSPDFVAAIPFIHNKPAQIWSQYDR
jgi:hypothetical protein